MIKFKTTQQWLDAYGVCHQNSTNKQIHKICVPLIMYSLLALLWVIPVPTVFTSIAPWFNWSYLLIAVSLLLYATFSLRLMLGMAMVTVTMLASFHWYEGHNWPALWIPAVVIFVLAWIGQFIGHKIEGAKPAFLDDLVFLLIGPVWVLAAVYRRIGIFV